MTIFRSVVRTERADGPRSVLKSNQQGSDDCAVEGSDQSPRAADDILDLVARLDDGGDQTTDAVPVSALQPIVHLEADFAIGYEALARFEDGRDAGEHFRHAAETGRTVELELACCRAALRRLADIPPGTFVSTNVSIACLVDPELLTILRRADTSRIAVEVTQQSPVGETGLLDHHLAPAKSTGVRIAIDDVGVGDFSIDRVASTTPAMVKASPRLVADCDADGSKHRALSQVAELGRRLGAITIGVGVERPAEADVLRRLGFDAAQGYLFGKPEIDVA